MSRRRWPYTREDWKGFHRSKRESISSFYGGFDKDVLATFYAISSDGFHKLLRLYGNEHGSSAASYARKTYPRWKSGETQPSAQTIERLLMLLPQILPFDEKCELLKKLRERLRKRENFSLRVDTNNWSQAVIPLVKQLIEKSYTSQLPEHVLRRLKWLSSGDAQIAQLMLTEIEIQTTRNAVRLLCSEFDNIDQLIASLPGKREVVHTISLPYGDIRLKIRGGKKMSDNNGSLAPRNQSLFRPTARDILDNAFADLDEGQAKAMREKASQEALQIEVDRARAEMRFDDSSREMDNFIRNAQTLDKTVQEYDLRSTIESASGVTQVHVRRNRTQTQIAFVILVFLCVALLMYLAKQ